jgi:DNA-binding NarL/FixJ family response regulator
MAQKGITVIVVEDETLVRMDLAMSLENDGSLYSKRQMLTTPSAFWTRIPKIRLMFTDIDMPGSIDGLKLAEAVRDSWPPVKIIVASGHRHLSDELLPVEGRSKPYDHTRVITTIREMLAAA